MFKKVFPFSNSLCELCCRVDCFDDGCRNASVVPAGRHAARPVCRKQIRLLHRKRARRTSSTTFFKMNHERNVCNRLVVVTWQRDYAFNYDIQDGFVGMTHARSEVRKNGVTKGFYRYSRPDGVLVSVRYAPCLAVFGPLVALFNISSCTATLPTRLASTRSSLKKLLLICVRTAPFTPCTRLICRNRSK